jgi:hypothetical protein
MSILSKVAVVLVCAVGYGALLALVVGAAVEQVKIGAHGGYGPAMGAIGMQQGVLMPLHQPGTLKTMRLAADCRGLPSPGGWIGCQRGS